MRPRRSVLYLPGSNARAIEKAKTLDADAIILDLEDAVAPEAKDMAREQVCAAVAAGGFGHREIVIRINALSTSQGNLDLAAALKAKPDAILLPKIETASQIADARRIGAGSGGGGGIALWAMIETPLAILNLKEIAAAAASAALPLRVFVLGTNDLVKATRARLDASRISVLPWLSLTVAAARAFELGVIDGVYNAIGDVAGFEAECEQGRTLGMDGKTLIHPSQIDICNRVFSPSPAEVENARKIVAAFEAPENKGKGAISLDGRMVELLHAEIARETLGLADAIAARSAASSVSS